MPFMVITLRLLGLLSCVLCPMLWTSEIIADNGQTYEPLPIRFDYVCGVADAEETRLWLATGDPRKKGRSVVISQPLTAKGDGPTEVAFTSDLVTDFPDWERPGQTAKSMSFSRIALYRYPDRGFVCLVSAFAGSRYMPGRHPLIPLLFSSPSGKPGTWVYHGRLAGEPKAIEDERKIWSDNGGIVPLNDGRWRIYLNGYGTTLAACEAESLDGPWTFVRNDDGSLRNIAAAYAPKGPSPGGAIFPFVLQVSDNEYHLWLSQGWPVRGVHHYSSADGLAFSPYGDQPALIREGIGMGMKGIRAFVSADGTEIRTWVPFWLEKRWHIHESRIPLGLQPKK